MEWVVAIKEAIRVEEEREREEVRLQAEVRPIFRFCADFFPSRLSVP